MASPLVIAGNLTVDGTTAPGIVLSGGGTTEVLSVNAGVTATINGLIIENGLATQGGGLSNAGTLTVINSEFLNDTAQGTISLWVRGQRLRAGRSSTPPAELIVTGSTFTGDSAIGGYGFTPFSIINAAGQGGAIFNAGGASLTATNDTFTGNSAQGGYGGGGLPASENGGAIFNAGAASLVNVTIDANSLSTAYPGAGTDGAGIDNASGATLDLFNSIVANNTFIDDVANAGTVRGGSNLVATSTGVSASIITSTASPQLAPLASTGGTTPTQVPLPGSPAIDAGSNALLSSSATAVPGLVDLWLGNGNAQDSAGTSAGTLNGGVTFAAGLSGQAFQLNGTSAYVAIPPSADIVGTGGFAVSAWIKTTAANGVIVQQRDANNYNGEYQLSVTGGKVAFAVYGNSSTT